MPFIPDETPIKSSFVPDNEEDVKTIKKSSFVPDKPAFDVNKSTLISKDSREPSDLMAWTPPGVSSFVPDEKEAFYPKFVNTLSKIQSGARGVVRETVEALQDPTADYEPIKKFKESMKGEDYVTASDVFKELSPNTKSEVLNILIGSGQAAAEVSLDFLTDPTVYLMWAGGKSLKAIYKLGKMAGLGKPLGRAVDKLGKTPAGKKVIEWMVYSGNQPHAYQKLAETRLDNIKKGYETAENIGAKLSKGFSKAEQQRIGQIVKGGVSVGENEKTFRRVAGKARFQLTKVGKQAVEQGLLSEEKFAENMKTYMPRLYAKWEQSGGSKGIAEFFKVKPTRIQGKRFLLKKDIPIQIRAAMGEITTPAYPVAKGIAQVTHDVETAKMFNTVAKNPEWVSALEKPGFIKLADSKKLGDLSGKYVTEAVAKDINEITAVPSAAMKLYNSFMGYWKYSKTVANPASHFRNLMSNTILLDLSGVDHIQQMRLIPKSGKEMATKGTFFREAKKGGLFGHEFVGGEIKTFMGVNKGGSVFDRIANVVKPVNWVGKKAGQVYQGEEQIFKLAKFISEREKGATIDAAVKAAEKWLFNYEKVPKAVNFIRKHPLVGSPFFTFAAKAIPRAAEVAITNPLRIGKYSILMKAIENQSKEHLNMSDEEVSAIKENRRGIHLVLPARDKYGLAQTLDISYILPWGDVGETGGAFGLPSSLSPNPPVLKTVAELAFNKSMFTGREIYKDTDSGTEKASKIGDFLAKNLVPLPTWCPPGYSWSKLTAAIEQRPDYYGRVRGLPKVLSDIILGIKISPIDVGQIYKQEENKRKYTESELKRDLSGVLKHPGVKNEEKTKKARVHGEKLKRLYEDKRELNTYFRVIIGGGT